MKVESPAQVELVAAIEPMTLGACATLACIWEATAAKPGNVYRGADFADLSYVDFLTSAAAVTQVFDSPAETSVGRLVLRGVEATRAAIGARNTNLGILLLFAPLAMAHRHGPLATSLGGVLGDLREADARDVYAAIRLVQPGGLGRVERGDVNDVDGPLLPLRSAMELGSERDLVARQYVNEFAEVFHVAGRIAWHLQQRSLNDAIIRAYLELLRAHPDSLIARKCGREVAEQVSSRAEKLLDAKDNHAFASMLSHFDFWLRSDGNRLNPGTSADIVAAALFMLLIERKLKLPVTFYGVHLASGH